MNRTAAHVVTFAAGLVFALGLGLAGLTRPDRIIGFLNFAGDWDPTLLFALMGAVMVYLVTHRFVVPRRARPVFENRFQIPTRRDVDGKLVAGAALFGAGWGLAGLCPGPALTSLAVGGAEVLVFVGTMLGGMLLHRAWDGARARTAAGAVASSR